MMNKEIWRDVKGYEGLYQVSSWGNIKSYYRRSKGKCLRPRNDIDGYPTVCLYKKGCKARRIKVHRLVAEAFMPNPNNLPVVNHLNGIKDDNRVENLEWETHSGNRQHAWDNGLMTTTQKKREASSRNITKFNSKLVLNTITGIYYDSIKDAALSLHIRLGHTTLHNKLNGHRKNNTPFIYA